nr:unnamed protein product [Spirometra erinaceieuropaei]
MRQRNHRFSISISSPPGALLIFLVVLQAARSLEVPSDFPCSDETWTYVANNGQCYKVISGPKKFNWSEGEVACKSALASVSAIPVVLPEVHNESEANAMIEFLVKVAVKEKIWLGARREEDDEAVVYGIPCQNCNARYVGETGKRLCTRLHEHQLAVNREDKLSPVYGHMQQEEHSFAFGEASVLGRVHDKMARLVLESWSSVGTINRAIDLHPAYQALRTRLQSVQTGPTVLASESWLLQQLSPSQQGRGASRRSHDQSETSPHRRAQTAERDSHMQQQPISSSDYEVRAHGNTGFAAITTAGQGAEVTGARHWPPAEGPKPIRSQRAGQSTCVRHAYNTRQAARQNNFEQAGTDTPPL